MKPKYIALTVLSAIATGLLYTFYELGLLSFITLIPYFYVFFKMSFESEKQKSYRLGLLFSFPYYISVWYWFCYQYPLDYMGFSTAMSVAYVAVAWFGLSLLYSVSMAIVPFVASKFLKTEFGSSRGYFAPFMLAAVWTVVEWMHTKTFLGVPWCRLALTQQSCIENLQISSVLGSYAVSFIIVFVNAMLAYGIYSWKKNGIDKKVYICFGCAAITALTNSIYGAAAVKLDDMKGNDTVIASATQGNMMSSEKWESGGTVDAFKIYEDLVKEASNEGSELIVFPETAFPTDIRDNIWLKDKLCELAKAEQLTMFIGGFDGEWNENGDYDSYNAMYMFTPDGQMEEKTYVKRKLVPFGEYLPCEDIFCTVFPFLNDLNLFDDVLTPGEESALFDSEYGKIGALICFDSIYELLSVQSVGEGAELLILGTNDSWFVDSSAIYEHNGQAVLRAIENRRYVVRSANTGVSTVISSSGEVLSSVEPLVKGQITEAVKLRTDTTFYTEHPNALICILHLFVVGMFIVPKTAKIFLKKVKNT